MQSTNQLSRRIWTIIRGSGRVFNRSELLLSQNFQKGKLTGKRIGIKNKEFVFKTIDVVRGNQFLSVDIEVFDLFFGDMISKIKETLKIFKRTNFLILGIQFLCFLGAGNNAVDKINSQNHVHNG